MVDLTLCMKRKKLVSKSKLFEASPPLPQQYIPKPSFLFSPNAKLVYEVICSPLAFFNC